ncbi:hypothetical protein [Listeria fleischmannii]|uniref:Uncharacterized protein n=1 Tax=Listeria fleischmannii FSL S10-1203 TaxID=1265822 RepID=W7DIT4_9LIST|nr:hypothetical protein [Listeria fleischmannii]EUJ64874.1 hypothetical protein MCOL2_01755 [Listeria fleischmannii FSL S10-1203]
MRCEENQLFLENVKIEFNERIDSILEQGDRIYILLDISPKAELDYNDYHNIYAYSTDGKLNWQIQPRPQGDEAVYTMINFNEGKLYANDFLGRRYLVDEETGVPHAMKITK